MNDKPRPDWDPMSDVVQRDQRAAYDAMREQCPVAYSDYFGWSLFRHQDVVAVLNDPGTFSNVVSRQLAIPSGMDPPEHTAYRRIIVRYFAPEIINAFEPACRMIAGQLMQGAIERAEVEFSSEFAQPFAVRAQCDFLGWPTEMYAPLQHWTLKSHGATLAQDRTMLAEIAREFEGYVHNVLETRRAVRARASDDLTTRLMCEQVHDRPLRDGEIVSILRNWTAGEVGTLSAAVTILAHFVATEPQWQEQLRTDMSLLPQAIDEILRLYGPLVANRRITTRAVELGGRKIGARERISLNWIAANRDGRVFQEPETFRLDRDPTLNLLYGAGIHVCPGAPLARLELRVVMEELLSRSASITLSRDKPPQHAFYPASGYSQLPLTIR